MKHSLVLWCAWILWSSFTQTGVSASSHLVWDAYESRAGCLKARLSVIDTAVELGSEIKGMTLVNPTRPGVTERLRCFPETFNLKEQR